MISEDKERGVLRNTRLTAHKDLKNRVMQQIETEKALMPKKTKKSSCRFELLKPLFIIFPIYGAFLLIVFTQQHEATKTVLYPLFLIGFIGLIIWGLSSLDEKLIHKIKHKS